MTFILRRLHLNMFITFIFLINSIVSQLQPTRNVSVDSRRLIYGSVNIHFVCPNVRSSDDSIHFYQKINGRKELIEHSKGNMVVLKIKRKTDIGVYECSVVHKDKTVRNATLNIMDKKNVKSATKLIYNSFQTKYVVKVFGSVELDCDAKEDEEVTWYRPAQYHIHSGNKFKIESITDMDYGTYYCVIGITKKETLFATKVILLPKESKERSVYEDVTYLESILPKGREVRYLPREVKYNEDVVTWEQPSGTILLEYGREFYLDNYLNSHTQLYFYYRINRNGDYLVNKVGNVFISQWKDKEVQMSVEGVVAYGAEIKLHCYPNLELGNVIKVIWKRENKIISHRNTYIIDTFDSGSFGRYSCEIEKKGMEIKRRYVTLTPEKSFHSNIQMMSEPGKYYNFTAGQRKELNCKKINKRSKVVWTFNGRTIESLPSFKRFKQLNVLSKSILILEDMNHDNEGSYKCFQGFNVLEVILLMETKIKISIDPSLQTTDDTINYVEFNCKIDTSKINSSLIKWSFKPAKSYKEESLPAEAKVVMTDSSSFITIETVLKRHEGIYVCRVLDKKVSGRLIVKTKPVKQKNIPEENDKFLCRLIGIDKITFKNENNEGRNLNQNGDIKRNSEVSFLIKKMISKEEGAVYECIFKNDMKDDRQYIEMALIDGKQERSNISRSLNNLRNVVDKISLRNDTQMKDLIKEIQDLKSQIIKEKYVKNDTQSSKESSTSWKMEKQNISESINDLRNFVKIIRNESKEKDAKLKDLIKEIKKLKEDLKQNEKYLTKDKAKFDLRSNVTEILKENKLQNVQLKELVQEIKVIKKKSEDNRIAIEADLSKMKTNVNLLTDTIQSLNIGTNTMVPIGDGELRIDNFSINKASNKILIGPTFYSHANGYKLGLFVYAGGHLNGKGTHLSMFVFLRIGEYDNLLPWPCKYLFKLSVINQNKLGKDVSQTLTYSTSVTAVKNALERPKSINDGVGFPMLISLTDLESISGFKVNDIVIVKCTVTASS